MYDYKVVDGALSDADKSVIRQVCKDKINEDYINRITSGVSVGVLGLEGRVVGVVVYTIHEKWTLIHLFCAPGHGIQLQRELEQSNVPKNFALGSLTEQKVITAYQNLGYTITYNDLPSFYGYLGKNEVIMTKSIGQGGRRSHPKLLLKVRKTRRQRGLVPKNPARKRTRRIRS
jgi:hypothetical protein